MLDNYWREKIIEYTDHVMNLKVPFTGRQLSGRLNCLRHWTGRLVIQTDGPGALIAPVAEQ